ncbi:diguanylate cyclase domain-containing protein [Escherichia coli]
MLAQAIKQSIRKSDYAIRLGGDEFCIILVDSTPQIAAQLPERIEKRLQHIAPQRDRLLFRYLRDERKRYVT